MMGPNMTEMCWLSVPGSCVAVLAVVAMLLATDLNSCAQYRDSRSSKPPFASIFCPQKAKRYELTPKGRISWRQLYQFLGRKNN
jgi:hypothetical protein